LGRIITSSRKHIKILAGLGLEELSYPVYINIYDLSTIFTELTMIDGIYHSGLVIHGREYYLTTVGICSAKAG
jgi:hypothetical protein